MSGSCGGSEAANGLLDGRDKLLGDLAQRLRISVTEGARGTVEVRLGTGAAAAILVPQTGDAIRIGVRDGPSGAEVVLDPTHAATVVRLPASGSLAGLIEAERQAKTATDAVDTLAQRFAGAANVQHSAGADALGDPGGALFATQTVTVAPGKANAGNAPVDVSVADNATLFATGYHLLRIGGAWTLSRANGSGAMTGNGPLTLDGVTVTPGQGAADGDQWGLAVTGGAAGIALRSIGPERIAAASQPAIANSQDNGNALALAALRDQAGPGGTVEQSLDATTAAVGSALSETNLLAAAATALASDTAKAANAATGIDLDTEAADLTRLQTAYRANAQVIAAAKSLFDTLLQAAQ